MYRKEELGSISMDFYTGAGLGRDCACVTYLNSELLRSQASPLQAHVLFPQGGGMNKNPPLSGEFQVMIANNQDAMINFMCQLD